MDNWGDPWSDNADNITPAPKNAVTSPPSTTFNSAPGLLNGFLDDAGWGNDEDSFGDWATSTGKDAEDATPVKTRASEPFTPEDLPGTSRSSLWDTKERDDDYVNDGESDWAASNLDRAEHDGYVPSETSDSSTTIPGIESSDYTASGIEVHPRPDDDSSARPSTSPSEGSHNEIPIDSPRTSYEEEQGAERHSGTEAGYKQLIVVQGRSELEEATQKLEQSSSEDADAGNRLGNTSELCDPEHGALAANDMNYVLTADLGPSDAADKEPPRRHTTDATTLSGQGIHYTIDQVLLDALVPSSKETPKLEEAPDDPVYSTSGRKAWYRLTRKQTLREYNSGNADDNYIRVTWANSNIRSEVNAIVGRWAREDRISGTGPGARASFYWDSPAPTEANTPSTHAHQKSSVVVADESAPARQSLPPLSTNVLPAFNWSSPSVADEPWQQSGPRARSTSSPMVSSHPAIRRVLAQEGGTVPYKSMPPKLQPSIPEQPAPPTEISPATVSSIVHPDTGAITTSVDPWADSSSLDMFTAPMEQHVGVLIDNQEDDEWGDMVTSPTMSIPSANDSMSQVTTRSDTFSTPVSTPQSAQTPSMEDKLSDPMPASAIVRLKSTISPTSALFKTNTFVPLGSELGPIGSGILKPVKRSPSAEVMDMIDGPDSAAAEEISKTGMRHEIAATAGVDLFASWDSTAPPATSTDLHASRNTTSTFALPPLKPVTITSPLAPTPAPADNGSNAWADADFSMFETARPATPPPPLAEARYDQADSYSPLNYSPRSTRGDSPARSITRSRGNTLLPALQMLTGATNSSQRQKADEDQIIADILSGLPDLSYMLA